MPYTGDTYALPAGTAAVSNTTANSTHINDRFNDLEAAQNAARPLSAGGTGATSASAARTALGLVIGTNVQAYDADLAAIAALADPNADRILFWDDSAGAYAYLTAGTNLTITGTTLSADTQTPADGSITFAKLAAAAVVTESETIASNDNDTTIPTSAAVKAYADTRGPTLLATLTGAASATLDTAAFNNAVYSRYRAVLQGVIPATDGVSLMVRFSTNGGASYPAGATAYDHVTLGRNAGGGNTNANSTGADAVYVAGTSPDLIGNAAGEDGVSGEIVIYNAASATLETVMTWQLTYHTTSGERFTVTGSGGQTSAADTDAIRFLFSSGNITSGTIKLWGEV